MTTDYIGGEAEAVADEQIDAKLAQTRGPLSHQAIDDLANGEPTDAFTNPLDDFEKEIEDERHAQGQVAVIYMAKANSLANQIAADKMSEKIAEYLGRTKNDDYHPQHVMDLNNIMYEKVLMAEAWENVYNGLLASYTGSDDGE